MWSLKKGDKFLVLNCIHKGWFGKFNRITPNMNLIVLNFKGGEIYGYYPYEVALGIKDTKIARKLNKDRIVAEKNGYIYLKLEE